jgi:hypothetical protein
MSHVIVHSGSHDAWQRVSRSLKSVWSRPEPGGNPYSPLFCLSLLLVVGVLVKLGP